MVFSNIKRNELVFASACLILISNEKRENVPDKHEQLCLRILDYGNVDNKIIFIPSVQ